VVRGLAAGLAMSASVVWLSAAWVGTLAEWLALGTGARVGHLCMIILAGVLTYGATLALLGVRPRHFREPPAGDTGPDT
jgi:putative peptidoglycan lipid II flippase